MKRFNSCKATFALLVFTTIGQAGPLDRWTWRYPLPTGNSLQAIVFGNGRFVAVGEYGTILTSSNAVDWTIASSGTYAHVSAITHGNGRFVAVASENPDSWRQTFLTSTDGLHWLRVEGIGPFSYVESLTFGNGRFVALPSGTTTTLISTNGLNWVSESTGTVKMSDLAYGGGQFVAVGSRAILTSLNGTDWIQTYSEATNIFHQIAYTGGQFWAIGTDQSDPLERSVVLSSIDAVTWSQRSDITTEWLGGIIGGNGKLVAWSSAGGDLFASTDGLNWNQTRAETFITDMAYGNGQFVGVGFRGSILRSPDATNWVQHPATENFYLGTVSYGDGRFVAAGYHVGPDGQESTRIFTSTADGDWLEAQSRIPGKLNAVAYGSGKFVAAGADANNVAILMTSPDGLNWIRSSRQEPTNVVELSAITYAQGQFLALGLACSAADCVRIALISQDGSHWTQHQADFPSPPGESIWDVSDIVYGNGQFVALGESESRMSWIYSSSNGVVWTRQSFDPTNTLRGITFGQGQFVAVGAAIRVLSPPNFREGTILTSTNGTDWVSRGSSEDYALTSVAYGDGLFVAVQRDHLLTSSDGTHWFRHEWNLRHGSFLPSVAYGDGRFVVVGSNTILESESVITLGMLPNTAGGLISLSLSGPAGRLYTVESSSDLRSWQSVTNLTTSDPTTEIHFSSEGRGSAFYRAFTQ